jgi:hypothetical protein
MKEQFVTYNIALKLKEIGYCKITRFGSLTSLYTKDGKHTFYANYGVMYSGLSDGYINAPLWQEVIDWFREKHNITIDIAKIHNGTDNYHFALNYMWEFFEGNYYEAREGAILKAIELCKNNL